MLGTPALFATAYGNVGSSIYYALGLTAVYALGLTPLVFLVAGIVFAMTAATYAEGTARYPGGGRLGELRPARLRRARQLHRGLGADARLHRHGRRLGVLRAALPLGLLGAAEHEPVGHRRRRDRDRRARLAERRRRDQEAAKLSISLAVVDFATQILLVILGFVLVFNAEILSSNVHWGVAPTWAEPRDLDSRRDARLHGRRDGLEPRRGGARSGSNRAERVQARRGRRVRDLLHAAA